MALWRTKPLPSRRRDSRTLRRSGTLTKGRPSPFTTPWMPSVGTSAVKSSLLRPTTGISNGLWRLSPLSYADGELSCKIRHIPGRENKVADWMSRPAILKASPVTSEYLSRNTIRRRKHTNHYKRRAGDVQTDGDVVVWPSTCPTDHTSKGGGGPRILDQTTIAMADLTPNPLTHWLTGR